NEGVCDCPKKTECESPGKHPRTMHGLDDATTDTGKIRTWWGWAPHAGVAVGLAHAGLVDVAPPSVGWDRGFIWRRLPPPLSFASGGGDGPVHYLYARSERCPTYRLCQTGEYDILSAGYAVMPPTTGRVQAYTWLTPPDGMLIGSPGTVEPEWVTSAILERT